MSGVRKRFRRVLLNQASIWECAKSMTLETWEKFFAEEGVTAHTIQPLIIEMPFGQKAPVHEVNK